MKRTLWHIKQGKEVNLPKLKSNHEEGDTRIILHCMETKSYANVVSARDTDIFILLVAHFADIGCSNVWMKAGTQKKPTHVPVKQIITAHGLKP